MVGFLFTIWAVILIAGISFVKYKDNDNKKESDIRIIGWMMIFGCVILSLYLLLDPKF